MHNEGVNRAGLGADIIKSGLIPLILKLGPALEPLLTVVMGLMMAWIMIAVLGPVYDTMTNI